MAALFTMRIQPEVARASALRGHGPLFRWRPSERDEQRARLNHDQSLAQLHVRGGVSWAELAAILEDRAPHRLDDEEQACRDCFAALQQRGPTPCVR